MKKLLLVKSYFFIALLILFSTVHAEYTIALQPIGDFDSLLAEVLTPVIKSQFNNPQICLLKPIPLPDQAYYKPRNRYRAEILCAYLDSIQAGKYTKIVGFTQKDISTTKGEYPDWGIFGLGFLSQAPCVISTFRMGKNADKRLFKERFLKVVIHELGHTFGLDHCPNSSCIMTDYKGTIKSLDVSKLSFCEKCSSILTNAVKFMSIH